MVFHYRAVRGAERHDTTRKPAPPPEPEPTPAPQQPTKQPTPEPQPSTSGKRKQTETHSEAPQPKKPTNEPQWWQKGDLDTDQQGQFRWVNANTVPYQKRIYAKTPEYEKLEIAKANAKIRYDMQLDLEGHGHRIRYKGKYTPMGIPGNGEFDENNLEHLYAVLTVGNSNTPGPMAIEVKQRIDEQKQREKDEQKRRHYELEQQAKQEEQRRQQEEQRRKQEEEQHRQDELRKQKEIANKKVEQAEEQGNVKPLHVTYKGYHFTIILYNNESDLKNSPYKNPQYKLKITDIPTQVYNVEAHNEADLVNELSKIDALSTRDEIGAMYRMIIKIYRQDRHGL